MNFIEEVACRKWMLCGLKHWARVRGPPCWVLSLATTSATAAESWADLGTGLGQCNFGPLEGSAEKFNADSNPPISPKNPIINFDIWIRSCKKGNTCESQCESAKLGIRHLEFVRGAEVQRFSSFFGLSWNIIFTFFRLSPAECRWLWRLYGGMCDSFILFILEDQGPDLIIHVIFDLDPISYRNIQAGYDKVVRSRSYEIWSKFGGPGINVQIFFALLLTRFFWGVAHPLCALSWIVKMRT